MSGSGNKNVEIADALQKVREAIDSFERIATEGAEGNYDLVEARAIKLNDEWKEETKPELCIGMTCENEPFANIYLNDNSDQFEYITDVAEIFKFAFECLETLPFTEWTEHVDGYRAFVVQLREFADKVDAEIVRRVELYQPKKEETDGTIG